MPGLRRLRLPGVWADRLDDDPRGRDGPPGRPPIRRARPGALPGLRVRDGPRADQDAETWHHGPSALPRQRPSISGAVPVKVPLSWLREFVDVDLTPEALAERLTLLGMEVKGIVRRGEDWRNVVVGELLSVERHPRADRLSLTRATVGEGEPLEIVCGATNIAAGQRVPVALPGAVLPGDRRIERTEKMGVVSNGMLCSGDELGLTADSEGILILPPETPLGRPLAELYGDAILDVDVKPNRGDALSIVGLAREVAAATGGTLRLPPTDVAETGRPIGGRLRVEVLDQDLCPRLVRRWVSGV